jgi:hypothetical protein
VVAIWPDETCRYTPISARHTREEAAAVAAQHLGGAILHRVSTLPNPQDDF